MMDNAHLMKRTTSRQFAAFIESYNPSIPANENTNQSKDEFFDLCGADFTRVKNWFKGVDPTPNENEILPPFLSACAEQFSKLINSRLINFYETSNNLLNIQSLKSFAAVWSVLEFIFCLIEIFKDDDVDKLGSLVRFGEGVQICAAAIFCLTSQRPLYRCLSIGNKIQAHVFPSLSKPSPTDQIGKYLAVNKLISSSLSCAMASLQPTIEKFIVH